MCETAAKCFSNHLYQELRAVTAQHSSEIRPAGGKNCNTAGKTEKYNKAASGPRSLVEKEGWWISLQPSEVWRLESSCQSGFGGTHRFTSSGFSRYRSWEENPSWSKDQTSLLQSGTIQRVPLVSASFSHNWFLHLVSLPNTCWLLASLPACFQLGLGPLTRLNLFRLYPVWERVYVLHASSIQ